MKRRSFLKLAGNAFASTFLAPRTASAKVYMDVGRLHGRNRNRSTVMCNRILVLH